jgi:hypothetical protein
MHVSAFMKEESLFDMVLNDTGGTASVGGACVLIWLLMQEHSGPYCSSF